MESKDMLEDYLLSLGVSIKNKYTYLPNTGYDFKEKIKDETVTVGKHKIKLTKQYKDSRELRLNLNTAKDNFVDRVTVSDDMHKTCENILNSSIIYFTDVLKHLTNILDPKPEIMDKLIILCNGGINNVAKEIENALAEYNVKIAQAQAEGAAEYQSSLASSMAEIESKKRTYVALDSYHDPIMGDRVFGSASSSHADKAYAEGMMIGAHQAAAMIASIPVDVANKKAKEKISGIRANIIKKFNNSVIEFISAKFPKEFDEDILYNNGDNIEENPTYYQYYLDIIKDLNNDELEDFDKATKFYGINIESEIKTNLENEIVDYYLKNFKCDFDSPNYQLFKHLKFDEKSLITRVGNRLQKYFLDLPDSSDKKAYFAKIDELQPKLETCDYITDEDKKKIIETYDKNKKEVIGNRRSHATNIILGIVAVVGYIIAAVIAIWHDIVFGVYPDYDMGGWTFLSVIAVAAIIYFTLISDAQKIKKIVLSMLIAAFIALPIYHVPRLTKELAFREGKVMVQKFILDEETVEFVEKGTLIEFEDASTSGYYFNGWRYNYEYIEGPFKVTEDSEFRADLVPTNEETHKVTFKFKDGQPDKVVYVETRHGGFTPQDPVRKGYTFVGWYNKTTKEDIPGDSIIVYEQDLVIEAKWSKN